MCLVCYCSVGLLHYFVSDAGGLLLAGGNCCISATAAAYNLAG